MESSHCRKIVSLLSSPNPTLREIEEAIAIAHELNSEASSDNFGNLYYSCFKDNTEFKNIKQIADKISVLFSEQEVKHNNLKLYIDSQCNESLEISFSIFIFADDIKILEIFGGYKKLGDFPSIQIKSLKYALLLASSFLTSSSNIGIISPSSYAVNAITNWSFTWEKNSWRKKNGRIKNLKDIQEAFFLYKKMKKIVSVSFFDETEAEDEDAHIFVELKKISEQCILDKEHDFVVNPPYNKDR